MEKIKLSLGPVLFFWQKEALLEFYASLLDAPLDTVYLGEVVCSRRQKMRLPTGSAWPKTLPKAAKKSFCRRRCCSRANPI